MEKLSGLVLDYYDDAGGEALDTMPGGRELQKLAHILTADERDRLPEDVYALTLVDGDVVLKKFAMADAANTQLSVMYFLANGHKLPIEAQKTAAQNLVTGCDWYGLSAPTALEKIALGLGALAMGALVVPGAAREAKSNLQAVQPAGGTIMTPNQLTAQRMAQGV